MKLFWVREGEIGEYYYNALIPHLDCEVIPFSSSPEEAHPLRMPMEYSKGLPVYFFEDSKKSYLARALLGAHPGITILTSYFLTDYGPEPLHNSPWQANCGNLAKHDNDISFLPREFEWKQTPERARREAFVSLLSVFTSSEARAAYRQDRHASLSPLTGEDAYIPFPLTERDLSPVSNSPKSIAWCGSVNLEWRAHKILGALQNRPAVWLIDKAEENRARELCEEFSQTQVEIVVGRTPEAWRSILERGVISCHLLFSGFHTLSPYLEMSIASGLPVITSDYGYPLSFPPNLTYAVSPGDKESHFLDSIFTRILKGDDASKLKDARVSFAAENFTGKSVASDFYKVVKRAYELLPEFSKRWEKLHSAADKIVLHDGISESFLSETFRELGWA